MNVTQEIKSRLDIVDVVSTYVTLRKSGRNYAGFCPFHPNTRTPAFYIFPETQTWRCFGACAEGGDLFSFIMKKEGWDFKETLQHLAQRAGVTLEEHQPDKSRQSAEAKLVGLLTDAAQYFHMLLLHAPEAAAARRYVAERLLTAETLEMFQVGFALDSWDACRRHFNDQGYRDEEMMAAGLLSLNEERGTKYDRFRQRLMIPIRDVEGRVVGFGARTLAPDGLPKYLNSPQTAVFDKSHLLFGLDMARRHIREARQVVIVEGYMDVMQGWQHGYRNLVAQMGTALTGAQLEMLKRYTKRFVLALDADAAGAKATLRGLQVVRATLGHAYEVTGFDARGLVQYEARLQADIHVVTLPEGNDPDKLIRTNPAAWPELLARSQPVAAYVIDVLARGLDKNDAKAKTAVAAQVIPLIKEIANPVERDHYWQQLARALGVTERALRQMPVESPQPPTPPTTPSAQATAGSAASAKLATNQDTAAFRSDRATYFLRQCLEYPQLVEQVLRLLTQMGQETVTDQDFLRVEDRLLWQHLRQTSRRAVVTGQDLWDSLADEVLIHRVSALRQVVPVPSAQLDKLPNTLALSVLHWRRDQVTQQVQHIRQLVQEPGEADNEELIQLQQQFTNLTLAKGRIDKAIHAMSAVGRRQAEEKAATNVPDNVSR